MCGLAKSSKTLTQAELAGNDRKARDPVTVDLGPGKESVWMAKGCFHEAEIGNEIILGYPWLQENRGAVFSGDSLFRVGEEYRNLVEGLVKNTGPAKGKNPPDLEYPKATARPARTDFRR